MRLMSTALRLATTVSAVAISTVALPTAASAATCNWIGGSGLWATGGQWTCGTAPASGDDVVITSAGSTVNILSISAFARTLNLGFGNIINLSNSNLFIYNTSVTNNGTINLANGSQLLTGGGAVTFGGTGVIALDNAAGFANINGGGQIFTFGSGQTIRGAGGVGANNTFISNAGLISADLSGRVLSVDAAGGNGGLGGGLGAGGNAGFVNTGTMQATGGGILAFEGGRYDNNGVIQALNGSIVALNADSRIVGGTLSTVGTGVINAFNTSQFLQNVTLGSGSRMEVNNNNLYLNNSFTNNGTLRLSAGSQIINELGAGGALTISGAGTIVLDNSSNFASINGNGGQVIFGSNQSVVGSGSVGVNNTYLVNNNLFSANSGSTISIDAAGGNAGFVSGGVGTGGKAGMFNAGIVEATGSSAISFEGGYYENALGSVIRAVNNSVVNLGADSRIVGGILTSDATSSIRAYNATQFLTNVTLSTGSLLDVRNDNLYLNSSFTNNGTLRLSAGSQIINELGAGGALTITGAGTIVLDNSSNFASINGNGGQVIFGSNQSVVGSGSVGVNNTYLVNNNLFSANSGSTISIDSAAGNAGVVSGGVGTGGKAGMFNAGIVEATGNSAISFEGGYYENAVGSIIRAVNNSAINLNADSRIVGGILTSDATSVIRAHNTSQYMTNVTLSGGSNLSVNNDNLYLNTLFTTNGTTTLAAGAQLLNERAGTGALTIGGTGTIVLNNASNFASITGSGGEVILDSNLTVRGSGGVGVNNTFLTNRGLISADLSTGAISVDGAGGNAGIGGGLGAGGNAGMLNTGIMQGTNGGTLVIDGGLYDNNAGLIRAINGGFVSLGADSRVVGGVLTSHAASMIRAYNTSQYLQSVTLSAGSLLDARNDNLYLNTAMTINGVLNVSRGTQLLNERGTGGALAFGGTGAILLDNSSNFASINGQGGLVTFGSSLTVHGSGSVGANNSTIINNGFITADAGTGISIDVSGGNAGLTGAGVGTGGNAGLLNSGVISAVGARTLSFEGGLYENDGAGLGGMLFAKDGGTVQFNSDASFFNLKSGGLLDGGRLYASGYVGDATINLRSNAANSLVTIGSASGPTTEVILEGAGSKLNVLNFGSGASLSIDQTLTGVAGAGVFALHDRDFTVSAGGGNFSNAGLTFVNNTVFTSTGFANSGQLISDGTSRVTAPITNSGTVHVASGTLTTGSITGTLGTILTDIGATLNLGGASTAKTLTNNGTLALGTNTITVTKDYTNANFGTGNAFNGHANVTGSGLILAANATMDVTGGTLVGNTLNVGNVRTGGSSSTTFTITNNGTLTNIIGAVKNTNAPSVVVTGADFALAAGGGSTSVGISFAGTTAGSLAGQTLTILNNFDNVASQTIGLAGNVYQAAQAGAQSSPIILGARRVGDAASTSVLTIANVAPVTPGFNETLTAGATVGGGFLLNGAGSASVTNLGAGSTAGITVSRGTGAAGAFTSTIQIANTSNAVSGSGLADLALGTQSVTVTNNVYALAVANTSGNTVNFGTVRQGATSPTASIGITNGASGALADSLVTTVGATPAGVTGTGPGALGAGQSGNATFALNTATAGVVNGTGSLNFASHNSEMADASLASQTITYVGTVTELANATLFQNAGTGSFSGSGSLYTLNLGTLSANSGIFGSDIGVANSILSSAFAEALGGSFLSSASTGFTFAGNTFAGLAGGSTNIGNLLSFNTAGLANGTYSQTITFNGYSRFAGLADQSLSPITLNISATVTGAGGDPNPNPNPNPGAVPEPSTWMMMLSGFVFVGAMMRRKNRGPIAKVA